MMTHAPLGWLETGTYSEILNKHGAQLSADSAVPRLLRTAFQNRPVAYYGPPKKKTKKTKKTNLKNLKNSNKNLNKKFVNKKCE